MPHATTRSDTLAATLAAAVAFALFTAGCQATGNLAGVPTGPIAMTDLKGRGIRPLSAPQGKAAVVIFTTVDCPIANKFCPEFNRLHQRFTEQGVKLTLVHVDPDVTTADALAHAKDYRLAPPIVIDRHHTLVRALNAEVTPEAFVLNDQRQVVYRGRVNDLFPRFGDRRRAASKHDLRDAVDAHLAGKPIAVPRTKVVGCYIPPLPATSPHQASDDSGTTHADDTIE